MTKESTFKRGNHTFSPTFYGKLLGTFEADLSHGDNEADFEAYLNVMHQLGQKIQSKMDDAIVSPYKTDADTMYYNKSTKRSHREIF